MRIVVNAAFMPDIYSGEHINFLFEIFRRITKNQLKHQFIFICEEQSADLFMFGDNAEVRRIKSRKASAVLWKYWYDVRIPYFLRKYKADLFFSPGGFCSLNTKVPQCIISNDLSFLHFPSFFTKTNLFFYKNHTRKSIHKAKRIISLSQFTKEEIIKNYAADADKIDVIHNGVVNDFKFQTDAIKDETKATYSDGKEYFLYAGTIHASRNLVNLLKAFSLFKKRQQSNLKLIICGKGLNDYKSFNQLFKTYKYRNEVRILNEVPGPEYSKLMSAAYAFVYVVFVNDFSTAPAEAMKNQVPVITSENSALRETTAGAALYVNPENPRDIADAMMVLYKNEKLRNELIEKGITIANRYNSDKTAEQLWQVMQNALL